MKIATVFFQTVEGEIDEKNKYAGRYQQDKQENKDVITGYIPDKDLVEKVAAIRKKQIEEENARQEELRKQQEAEAAAKAAEEPVGEPDTAPVEAPTENDGPVDEIVTDAEVREAHEVPQAGDVIDMGDTIPGFSAEVVSSEVVEEPSAEVVVPDTPTEA